MEKQLLQFMLILGLASIALAKLCHEECAVSGAVQDLEIHGCHRRSTYPRKQDVVWQSGLFDLPWAGMETDICKYTNNGTACGQPGVQGTINHLMFPILISNYYPAGKYDLKWKILEHPSNNELACFLFTIKIV